MKRVLTATTTIAAALLLCGSAGASVWQVPRDFPTIQAAIGSSAVVDGDVNLAFPVFSRGADDVSVTHNTMLTPNQGVTSWANGTWGRGWDIAHNLILDLRTDCGGGIGILIGDYAGGTVSGNLIAHNEVRGRVRVPADDCGGYGAPGVVLFADWRYPLDTGATITANRVAKNRVFLSSTRPALVPVSGVQLTDTRDLATELDITGNEILYNDLRGMTVPVDLTPDELATVNRIEKNLTGPVGPWPDSTLRDFREPRPVGHEAAPVR